MKKRVAVLGATGSIGNSALDVISRDTDSFEVVLLSANSRRTELELLQSKFPSAVSVLSGEAGGKEKLIGAIGDLRPDITINGISGAAGLEPSIAAIEAGSTLALANKETIVMAGQLVINAAKERNVRIIPVDSEHSAIFKLIEAHAEGKKQNTDALLSEIILTASGGPFKDLSLKEMEKVTVKDTLAHPTWKMGKKITVDSSSMANKGLEIMEACALFNINEEKIRVVIHPKSIVHSMIRLCNGVIYAQLSKPDMRHPISDALYWPEILDTSIADTRAANTQEAPGYPDVLNFDSLSLEFEKPDMEKFPMLSLARAAARKGGLYPCAYNAANEEAVAAFLDGKVSFLDIPKITSFVLDADWIRGGARLEDILNADFEARRKAREFFR